MKILSFIFILSIMPVISSITCICPPIEKLEITQIKEYNSSEVVIIGNVNFVSENSKEFKLSVVEVFKGDLKENDIIKGVNFLSCEPTVNTIGKWLLYGKLQSGILEINSCGLSRSFDNPMQNRHFQFIQPPPATYGDSLIIVDDKEIYELEKEIEKKAFDELKHEIHLLRKQKLD